MSTEQTTDVSFQLPERGASPCFELVVEAGPDAGARLRIDGAQPDRSLVGQSAANDLVLSDRQVSRRHFAVEVKGSFLRLDDLGSTNGTVVGGVRIVQALLAGGERIVVGQTALTLARVAPDAPAEVPHARAFGRVIGASLAMRRVYPMLEKLAGADATLLLEGETGTGKELVAEALHEQGPRAAGPFVVFDCAAAVDELGPARLLGDARSDAPGVFELAHGGTLVLDEVGELNLELQPLPCAPTGRGAARAKRRRGASRCA